MDTVSTAQPQPAARASTPHGFLASYRAAQRARQIGIVVIVAVGALAMIIPFEWMLATSLSRSANTAMPRIPRLWPADPSLFNYRVAITNLPLWRFYLNSLVVTTTTTLGYLFFSSLTGYAFAKGRFPGKTLLFITLLTTLMIPFEIRMIPLYLFMRTLHLNDTMAALILPFLTGGFGTFLMRQYMTTIPDELVDAARVDGASEFTIYTRVVLPLCGPALAALAVLSALWRWNDVLWPLLVISNRNLYTVTFGLAIAGRSQGIFTGVALANAALAILPIIVLYLFLQRFIIRGIMLTGLKG
ncbi:MAG TPA: carbohydrate ABC transporter permease [Anaerolineales bacterium]|nr:carbohydrate ABC transporter permease [Anaerolineales bacterium]